MPSRFFIYCWPRSGSYHLQSLLDSAPDIACYGELFKPRAFDLAQKIRKKIGFDRERRNADPLKFLNALEALHPNQHFGFKLFPSHLNKMPPLKELFTSPEWKIIALTREPIEMFASLQKAKHYKYWTAKQVAPAEFDTKIPFDKETYDKFAKDQRRYRKRIKNLSKVKDVFELDYADINNVEKQQGLLGFLGSEAAAASLVSEHAPQAGPRPVDLFEDPAAVLSYARQSGELK